MRRLFLLYGAALTCSVLTALLVPLGILARDLTQDKAMAAASQQAQGLTVLAGSPATSRLAETVQALNQGAMRTTVFLPGGRRIGAPTTRTASVRLAARGTAFTATTVGGREVLTPVAGSGGVSVIRTFVPDAVLTAGVRSVWTSLAAVGLFLLAVSSLVGTALARRLSLSITSLATVAARIGAGDLDARVRPGGPPEVESVGLVLNDLGARVKAMLEEEREQSADLSHRLRTPVTALQLDVEGLTDPDERTMMSGHVDALASAVDEAVTAARQGRAAGPKECDAERVVRQRGEFWSVLARDAGRPFTVSTPLCAAPVRTSATRLGAAIDALLDNAFRHTPDGTAFSLLLLDAGDRYRVVVTDDGPGMEAGRSVRGSSGAGSTGIGMDIARRTVQEAQGEFTLSSSPGAGTHVELCFPAWRNLNRSKQRA
jgi:signal transduction histidine kinase